MLLKKCYIEMNINFHLEKQEQHFSVTAFPNVVGNFFRGDIFQYKDNINDLNEKLLLLENVDFDLSQNNKIALCKYEKPYFSRCFNFYITFGCLVS